MPKSIDVGFENFSEGPLNAHQQAGFKKALYDVQMLCALENHQVDSIWIGIKNPDDISQLKELIHSSAGIILVISKPKTDIQINIKFVYSSHAKEVLVSINQYGSVALEIIDTTKKKKKGK